MKHACNAALASLLYIAAPLAGIHAETLYWKGANNGSWDTSSANWTNSSGVASAWVDGSDAVIANASAITVKVPSAISAGNISKPLASGNAAVTFTGTGPLSWTGWLSTPALGSATFNMALPLADNVGGLRFDLGANCILKAQNLHTGGTYIRNTHGTSGIKAFGVDGATNASLNPEGNDLALGPVPATACTNIYVQGGKVALFVNSSFTNTIHRNRTILISDNQTLYLNPNGKLRIEGDIVGQYHGNTKFPSTTVVSVGENTSWQGLTVLTGSNYVGRIYVPGRLEIADGRMRLVSLSGGSWTNAMLYVKGNGSAYNDKFGQFKVAGGLVVNDTQTRVFEVDGYGQMDIAGGTVQLTYRNSSELLLATNTPGKLTIRDGGVLNTDKLRLTDTAAGNGGEVFLKEGGTLVVSNLTVGATAGAKGTFHFDGGVIRSRGNCTTSATLFANQESGQWDGVAFKVEAGGAVFDAPSTSRNIFWTKPLASGAGSGETDGGLRKTGSGVLVLTAPCTYGGPTAIEEGSIQFRTEAPLPSGANLALANGGTASFSLYDGDEWASHTRVAQTLGRVSGDGTVNYCRNVTVAGAVAPDAGGTIYFPEILTLACDYEVRASGASCSLLKVNNANQDISGVTLKLADVSAFDSSVENGTYQILDAPYGYKGEFALPADFPSGQWKVKYAENAAYLNPIRAFMMVVR